MTPLWRRVVADHRRIVVPLAMLLVANVVAYGILVRPLQQKSEGAADRAVAASNSLKAAQKELAQARDLVDRKAQADEELSAFYQKVLPANFTAARRMTYARLPALADKTNVRYEARTHNVGEPDPESWLGQMSIRMVLQGEYRDIRRFIYELETAPEFIIIDNVTLTEGRSDEPQTLTIALSTYYRPESHGP